MNKQIIWAVLFFAGLAFSCKNSGNNQKAASGSSVDTIPFYLYSIEINKEVDSITSKNFPLLLTTTDSSGKRKMSSITKIDFKNLVKRFTDKDITKMPLKQFYKESVFNDMTTVSTVMNYATQKDSLPVKNVDVLLNAKNTGEVKRVDMKVLYNSGDSVITENYSWIFKKAFYILRYAEAVNGKGVATKINVSWEK